MNKTQILMNRIVQVDNFQNMACVCANFEEFVEELAEWGVDHAAGIDFDDPELDIPTLDKFIKDRKRIRKGGGIMSTLHHEDLLLSIFEEVQEAFPYYDEEKQIEIANNRFQELCQ